MLLHSPGQPVSMQATGLVVTYEPRGKTTSLSKTFARSMGHLAAGWSGPPTVLAVALFYPVKNWRGKRAWDHCKRELEAKVKCSTGTVSSLRQWPEEQDIFEAPNMAEWFTTKGTNEFVKRLDERELYDFVHRRYTNVVAELTVVSIHSSLTPGNTDIALRYDPPVLSELDAASSGVSNSPSAPVRWWSSTMCH